MWKLGNVEIGSCAILNFRPLYWASTNPAT